MKRHLLLTIMVVCLGSLVWAQSDKASDQDERSKGGASELQKATETVEHMSATAPDKGVPKQVLEGAKCVAVIPKRPQTC